MMGGMLMGNQIKIQNNGPLVVSGDFTLLDSQGNEYNKKKDKTYLCRCGQSNNKPFCDGSHKKVGFDSNPRFSD
jgi:CDGSH iron-sulfur domain-containing protein 3